MSGELVEFLESRRSYSLGLPIEIDFGTPQAEFWSTVFNGTEALEAVVRPLLTLSSEAAVFGYKWDESASGVSTIALRARIDAALRKSARGLFAINMDVDAVTGLERLWFGGLPRVMTAVPMVAVDFARWSELAPVFAACSADGSATGVNRGLYAGAVKAAQQRAEAGSLAFVFRGDELQVFYPHTPGACQQLAELIQGCQTMQGLRSRLRTFVASEKARRRGRGEVI